MTTIDTVCREFIAFKTQLQLAGQLTKQAWAKSVFYVNSFASEYGEHTIDQARRGDIKRWLACHPEYRSPHTLHDAASAVVTCFKWAEEEELIDRCPYSKPRDLPTPQPREAITRAEVLAMLKSARTTGYRKTRAAFRLALWFLWQTGCRTCELYRLDWSQYDDARGCFELASKSTRKTGRKRLLALTRRAWRLIRWLWRGGIAKGPVFVNGQRRPWTKDRFAKLFRRHADAAGVRKEVSAYCLRHGFCVESLEAGAGERQIADAMGHSSTRYVAWYGRGVKSKVDYLRETMEKRK